MTMVKNFLFICFGLFFITPLYAKEKANYYPADNSLLQYMGRIEWGTARQPTMWAAAAQLGFSFKGSDCKIIITDEELYGKYHNYLDIIVDGGYKRIKLTRKRDTIVVAAGLKNTTHSVVISKSTEAGIGYIRFEGLICNKLVKSKALPKRKMESYGDSITSAMGSDTSAAGCHKADWYDQTNGYMSYAAITARALNAQYHLTSVSGIGMIHSCCGMDVLMPQVYDKLSLRENMLRWDFKKYQPDVVTICLGQNDGVQDSAAFCNAYIQFIKKLRGHYPAAGIVCLTSPMADPTLKAALVKYLSAIVNNLHSNGDKNIYKFYFSKQSISGCDSHPSLSEQQQIAGELTAFIKKLKNW